MKNAVILAASGRWSTCVPMVNAIMLNPFNLGVIIHTNK